VIFFNGPLSIVLFQLPGRQKLVTPKFYAPGEVKGNVCLASADDAEVLLSLHLVQCKRAEPQEETSSQLFTYFYCGLTHRFAQSTMFLLS